ncbi:putative atpase f0 complex subunit e mitochondrial [Phaeomoniella chlamydospora]|uniref:ATP synthase F(0) complex subunit e, mitochondrial n=1 Tax=Phaeomoniella chlamydospora TaxID=158046 RepID=A0A0G2E5Z2_PHACM|nr:putative atpase f0 complex subunit e mitochondrial [Phaeomoniella chlamydospora]
MSTSQGVNVLRWSALAVGVFYGFYHQSNITAKGKAEEAQRQYHHKESLIKKAKEEYLKKTNPQQAQAGGVISDPENPNFDLEAFLKAQEAKA